MSHVLYGVYARLPQLEALYSLLDDDGSGSLTVHEMIDLFVRHPMPLAGPSLLAQVPTANV